MAKKLVPVFPPNGQSLTDNHSDFCVNKSDIVYTNDVSLMYANETIRSKFLLELLKAFSYYKVTVIYELKTYIVPFRCHVDDLLF